MTCDNAVTKPYFGRVLSFSQQLKFRGAFSVEPHAHKRQMPRKQRRPEQNAASDFLKANSDEVLADRGEYCEAVGAIAEAVSKSVELIVQPDAHAAPGTSHCIGGGGTDLWPSAWRADFWSTTLGHWLHDAGRIKPLGHKRGPQPKPGPVRSGEPRW